jgi:hypothetical protein
MPSLVTFSPILKWSDLKKKKSVCLAQWLMPVILATWEAEIRRIAVQGQLGQIVHETPPPSPK